uniref:EGF-like domain-containing protein n=1 Tax=Romanomermis culicivorax TaxID=13658 RepID=A0A915KA31_ROMCU
CQCQKGFGGERCQQNLDDCQGHECKNGATCLDLVENYKCLCPANFSGWDCGQKVDFCSPNLNFCRNGATCQISGDFYKCSCAPGFQGPNCTENVDDCRQHLCQNGARCADKLNGYECRCKAGFAGRYCQYPTSMDNALYPKTSPCQQHDCKHCDHLSTLSFDGRSSYAEIEPLTFRPTVNLTLTFNSRRSYGVLLYVGGGGDEGDGHLGVELFEGRVRVSYFIGNKPVSLMFSALKGDLLQEFLMSFLANLKFFLCLICVRNELH